MEQEPLQTLNSPEETIDLISVAKKLWLGKKIIFKSLAVSAFLGLAIAILSPKEYTAASAIVPQLGGEGNSKIGGLGSLAALAGINLDMQQQGSEISPIVYPQIVSSIPFQVELMNTPLNFQTISQPVTLLDYVTKLKKTTILEFVKMYTIGLPSLIISAIRSKPETNRESDGNDLKPIVLTSDQIRVQKILNKMVTLNVNTKEGYLTIIVNSPEPLVSAQLALKAQFLLQKYITEFKTQKAQANLDFIEASYWRAKKEFEQAQVKLAVASDRSNSFISGLAKVETDRLQSQYTITFGVYQELAKQYEQAKIQVKKETPVFTVIDPPVVPFERTKPKRAFILILFLFLGGVTGLSIVLSKEYRDSIQEKWETL